MFHTFSYDKKTSSMLIAAKAYSDFGAHIPLIRSFSMGDNLIRFIHGTVEYPIYPGEPIRYHYIFYMVVGALERLGLRIDWALNIPSALGFFALIILLYLLAKRLFHSVSVGVLAVVFFLFNGSLSFLKFFQLHPISRTSLNDIIANNIFPSFAPWGKGDISAFWNLNIYTNQRHLAFAFALALIFISILLWIENKPLKKQALFLIPEVIILAIMPYFHQPILLILAIFMICYFFVFPRLRIILLLIGEIGALCILPQVLPLLHGLHTFRWNPGYLVSAPLSPIHILWYWTQNIGLHVLLIPLGWLIAPARIKKIMIPLFFVFLIPNLVQFSVEMAANHKFFNFFLVFGSMLTAYVLVTFYSAIKRPSTNFILRILGYEIIGVFIFFLVFSGIIDFFPIYNDGQMPFLDIPKNTVAAWIRNNTPADAVFLNSGYGFQPESIAGRKILHGWPYSTWSAGYDAQQRDKDMKTLFETTDTSVFCNLINLYHISYVSYQEPFDLPDIHASLSALASHARRVYTDEKFSIWIPLCQ
ncbi:MAG: hypothetical protein NT149_01685 [Candidatus Gottesmanbacteria bacterium]|nr:hypothetical protein [Candidatus Gottesmanbacteria bacterium]